ncbi:alpha/beta fold hydrolase [Streptodolium elevatio]
MRSTGKARTGVVGRRTLRHAAALAVVGVLAAAGCGRSGVDRVPEGGRFRPAAAPAPPSATQATPPTSAAPSESGNGTGAGAGSIGTEPEAEGFFDAPEQLPGDKPGGLVRERPAASDKAVAGAAKEQLVMYRTTGPDGKPVAATGTVALPAGPAPEGGWPVVAWDHGTTGIGATCAPTREGSGPSEQGSAEMLAEFVKRGYAVVQPDYIGMGVNGVKHPYLDGKSAAYATLDLVRAARELDTGVGKTVFVAGHSQGGHAALWSAHYAPEYAPELELKGVVAIAPANGFHFVPFLAAQGDPAAGEYIGIVLLLVNGAGAADPAIKPEDLLSEAGAAAAEKAWTTCVGAQGAQGQQPPSSAELFKAGADLSPLTQRLVSNSPDLVRTPVPVLMPQGGKDPLSAQNQALAQSMCQAGGSVVYKPYPDLAHDAAEVSTPAPDVVAWIEARKAGTPVEGACAS